MDASADGKTKLEWDKDYTSDYKYKNHDPKQGPAWGWNFLGLNSVKVFVWMTDFWHASQFAFLGLMFFSIVAYEPVINWWADFLVMRVLFGVAFEWSYTSLFPEKRPT